ncbi:MAG TPA: hypothetical protein VF782_14970 [Allosphingosinicella sp.]|jgi:hypothetical protein
MKNICRFAATLGLAFASTALAQGPASDDEALARDSAIYARLYGVDQAEAARRIKLMVSAQDAADSEEAEDHENLVAAYFDHGREFKLVVETAGTAKAKKVRPVPVRGKPGEQINLPVEYRKVNRPTRSAIRKIFREKNNMIERVFPEALITSYDERRGILTLTFEQGKPIADQEKKAAQLQNSIGVPVKILYGAADSRIGMRGGLQGYRPSGTSYIQNCTLGFAAQAPVPGNEQGYITAGHCSNDYYWKEPTGTTYTKLNVRDFQTATGDWQFVWGAPVERLIKADTGSFRSITGRRTVSSTCEKTGESSVNESAILVTAGGGSTCDGATSGTFVCWYPGHYSQPVAGAHGTHSVGHPGVGQQCGEVNARAVKMPRCGPTGAIACDYWWVEVIPKEGQPTMVAGEGDSGSPVFAWNTAFGIMTNAGWYGSDGNLLYSDPANGRVTHMWYTPIDEIYNKGYQLLY